MPSWCGRPGGSAPPPSGCSLKRRRSTTTLRDGSRPKAAASLVFGLQSDDFYHDLIQLMAALKEKLRNENVGEVSAVHQSSCYLLSFPFRRTNCYYDCVTSVTSQTATRLSSHVMLAVQFVYRQNNRNEQESQQNWTLFFTSTACLLALASTATV